jgi:hypothetical protein
MRLHAVALLWSLAVCGSVAEDAPRAAARAAHPAAASAALAAARAGRHFEALAALASLPPDGAAAAAEVAEALGARGFYADAARAYEVYATAGGTSLDAAGLAATRLNLAALQGDAGMASGGGYSGCGCRGGGGWSACQCNAAGTPFVGGGGGGTPAALQVAIGRVPSVPPSVASAEYAAWREVFNAGLAAAAAAPPLDAAVPPEVLGGALGSLGYDLIFHDGEGSVRERCAIAAAVAAALPWAVLAVPPPLPPPPGAGRPMRVGFISEHLHAHPVGRMIARLMLDLPRGGAGGGGGGFVVVAFPLGAQPRDFVAAALARGADEVRPLRVCGGVLGCVERNRAAILAARLDAIVYPELGMSQDAYLLALSRLAPLQLTSHGNSVTSGLGDSIDYYVSLDDAEPRGGGADYAEQLLRLDAFHSGFVAPPHYSLDAAGTAAPVPRSDTGGGYDSLLDLLSPRARVATACDGGDGACGGGGGEGGPPSDPRGWVLAHFRAITATELLACADYMARSNHGTRLDVPFEPPPPPPPDAPACVAGPPLLITSLLSLTRLRPSFDAVVLEILAAEPCAVLVVLGDGVGYIWRDARVVRARCRAVCARATLLMRGWCVCVCVCGSFGVSRRPQQRWARTPAARFRCLPACCSCPTSRTCTTRRCSARVTRCSTAPPTAAAPRRTMRCSWGCPSSPARAARRCEGGSPRRCCAGWVWQSTLWARLRACLTRRSLRGGRTRAAGCAHASGLARRRRCSIRARRASGRRSCAAHGRGRRGGAGAPRRVPLLPPARSTAMSPSTRSARSMLSLRTRRTWMVAAKETWRWSCGRSTRPSVSATGGGCAGRRWVPAAPVSARVPRARPWTSPACAASAALAPCGRARALLAFSGPSAPCARRRGGCTPVATAAACVSALRY